MALNKRIILDWNTTGLTVYCIIRRESDNYRLSDADGTFAAAPADPYISLTEDAVIKMRYELNESRTVWNDGRYTVAIYNQTGGSPVPVSDIVIGTGELHISNDIETVLDHSISETPDLIWDEDLTSGTHNVNNSAGKRIRDLKEQSLYEGGVLYIDTVGGAAGSESYVNGTLDNPVDNIADLNTLAAALNISSFKVAAGSAITFAAAQEKQNFIGNNWTLALGGQSINGAYIEGAACSGIALAATVNPVFVNCKMNGSTIPANTECYNSNLDGDLILGGAGTFILERCYSLGSPSIDFGAANGNTTVNMGHYAGNIEFKNVGQLGTDLVEIEGNGDITLNANCIGGTLNWAGHFRLTDNSGDSVTITGDNIDVAVKAIQGTTFSASTDSLEAIRNQGDAAWTTGSGSIASVILAEKVETLLDINKSLDLTVNTTTRLQYQWLDINGDPVNITGSTFKFKAVKNAGETSPAIAEVTGTIDDAVNGRFYFDVLPTTVFKGRYEIWAVDGASKITTLTKAGGSRIETHPRL